MRGMHDVAFYAGDFHARALVLLLGSSNSDLTYAWSFWSYLFEGSLAKGAPTPLRPVQYPRWATPTPGP